jgi:hypothetical protein
VLWGFVLVPLYALKTNINWEMLLFSGINLLSIWALLYVLLLGTIPMRQKLPGAVLILACAVYFALNLTFTLTASLAGFAGLSLILAATSPPGTLGKAPALGGMGLVLAASLIRIEMLALVLPLFVPMVVFIYRPQKIRTFALTCLATALLVLLAYGFDRLYVRAHPSWNAYYFYNKTAQKLQDAHRLENTGREIRRIGWTGNDQELFARYYFPDPEIYTVERIQYLIQHVPGASQNPPYVVEAFLGRLARPTPAFFLLAVAASWLWMATRGSSRYLTLALVVTLAVSLAENLTLIWLYKNPDYVLQALLAETAMLEVVILNWGGWGGAQSGPPWVPARFSPGVHRLFLTVVAVIAAIAVAQAVDSSNNNLKKQRAYAGVLRDLENLRNSGQIAESALIVSPGHGLPMEWSNPFVLQFPRISYLDTGWMTFSPPYQEVLQAHDIQSLPDAVYQKRDVYLMTRLNFKTFLARYYEEHRNISVTFQPIYKLPNTYGFAGYDDVQLYKVVQAR